jgi:hypothetical protein
MRGQPVLPSKFVSLFDSPSSNDSNTQLLRRTFILYHELDHHCEKFDENLVDFNKRLTQTVTDVRELLNGTYARFGNMDKISQLIDVETNEETDDMINSKGDQKDINDILDQSATENEHLPEPLAPEIMQPTKTDN